jgi:hypothetical protein
MATTTDLQVFVSPPGFYVDWDLLYLQCSFLWGLFWESLPLLPYLSLLAFALWHALWFLLWWFSVCARATFWVCFMPWRLLWVTWTAWLNLFWPLDFVSGIKWAMPFTGNLSRASGAPAVPAGVQTDGSGQPVGGETVAEFRQVPVTAHVCARRRRRAVWVRRLEYVLGGGSASVGGFVRGRWAPDLPSASLSPGANIALSHFGDGAKILGGGSVRGEDKTIDGKDVPRVHAYFVVELADGSRDVVFPELLSALSSYAFLRERSAPLVSGLRLRAQEWCKGAGFSKQVTWIAVPSAFKWAWHISPVEAEAREMLSDGPATPSWWGSA